MATYSPVTHAIFDMDGLLLDSVGSYLMIHQKILAGYGLGCTWYDLIQLMGHTALETAQEVCRLKRVPDTPENYRDRVADLQRNSFLDIGLMRGAERLVRHFHKHGVPIAIASGSSQASYDLKTTNHRDFMELFSHKVLSSSDAEVKAGKPAPDVFLVCAKRFPENPDPSKCLVFEDAPLGVEAAAAAGMQSVMIPDSRTDKKLTEKATLVLSSLEDFKPELFGLPAFDS